ncbi:hypothetical protein ACIQ62_00915 [Streptomyces sp. NPDC096319]
MIGLAFGLIKMTFYACFAMIDVCVLMCTLGKVDPKTRKFF